MWAQKWWDKWQGGPSGCKATLCGSGTRFMLLLCSLSACLLLLLSEEVCLSVAIRMAQHVLLCKRWNHHFGTAQLYFWNHWKWVNTLNALWILSNSEVFLCLFLLLSGKEVITKIKVYSDKIAFLQRRMRMKICCMVPTFGLIFKFHYVSKCKEAGRNSNKLMSNYCFNAADTYFTHNM